MQLCTECRVEIDEAKQVRKRFEGAPVCECCFELIHAIASKRYFVELHVEWRVEQKNRRRLLPGRDYYA